VAVPVERFLLVCLGSALGGGARYLAGQGAAAVLGPAFPYGTLFVNVIGSFLIGLVMHVGLASTLLSPMLRLFLTTGLMGGFTTYSTFNYETIGFLRDGAFLLAATNLLATVVLCLGAGLLGLAAGRAWVGG
jgi:CrcB protein